MDLNLSPDEHRFREEVREFLAKALPARIRNNMHAGRRPGAADIIEWQRILNAKGWATVSWPQEWGGTGWSALKRYIFMEELHQAPAPEPLSFNVNMLGPVLIQFGTPAQKEHFLPRLANLDAWFCQGFSEPGAGSDLASLKTTARRDGDDYVVSGQKTWTSSAQHANWMFCLVRTNIGAARKQEGLSFLLIDFANAKGLTVRPIRAIDGTYDLNEVFFDEVRVPVANLIGEENRGWDVAKFLLSNERAGNARVGLAKDKVRWIREHAAQVRVGSGALLDDPVFRHKLATLEIELKTLEMTQLRALAAAERTADSGKPDPMSSILKMKGSEIRQGLTELMVQVAGPHALPHLPGTLEGNGEANPLALDWPTVAAPTYFWWRAMSIYGGSNEIQRNVIAKAFLGL